MSERTIALVTGANKGIGPQEPSRVDPAIIRTVVETNVIGVVRVTNAMLPLLRRSRSPRIVDMSSSVGRPPGSRARPTRSPRVRSPSRTPRRRPS